MKKIVKNPKGYSVEKVEHKNNSLVVTYGKNGENIVPIRVIIGL